jgi:microcystin-dependent protein
MTFKRPKARILERTITAGNGPYTLGGAVDGSYNTFASFLAIGDTTYASVVEPGVAFWTGIVTYSATNQITLTTVEETKGTFGAGTKEIMCGPLASTATFREDIAGAIVTGGTSTAYTVASYRVYDTLARLDGNIIAFTPHTPNGQTVTLNVDGTGAKPLRPQPGVELGSNSLIQGTPYLALYNNTDGVFYLHGVDGNAYGIPLAGGIDYWAATTPSSAFAFPQGQQVSQTTYAKLYALFGANRYGTDAGGLFFLPDKTGRVSAMQEASASRLTGAGFGGNSTVLGATGGLETHALTNAELASHSHGVTDPGHGHTVTPPGEISPNTAPIGWVVGVNPSPSSFSVNTSNSSTGISIQNDGGGAAHANVQPTIVCNYIMRVL